MVDGVACVCVCVCVCLYACRKGGSVCVWGGGGESVCVCGEGVG